MKKLILSAVISLVALTSQAQKVAYISGNFINQKIASYTLYELTSDNQYEEIKTSSANVTKRKYDIMFDVNKNYLIKFVAKDNTTKYMKLIAYDEADIDIDVDFNSKKSISLVYDGKKANIKKLTEPLVFTQN
jgi:hypothetical protein